MDEKPNHVLALLKIYLLTDSVAFVHLFVCPYSHVHTVGCISLVLLSVGGDWQYFCISAAMPTPSKIFWPASQ
jgi:hypothetical protein